MLVIGRLTEGGYIFVSSDNVAWTLVHDAKIPSYVPIKHYTSIKKAKADLPPDPDALVMRVLNNEITHVYFSKRQIKRGFYLRLDMFKGCYGTIKARELP